MSKELMVATHVSIEAGHGGVARTVARLQSNYYWPWMSNDPTNFVKTCRTCQLSKTPKPARQPLESLERCDRANQRLHIDLIGPLKTKSSGDKYVMVMTNGFTKFCEVASIPHKSATVVARTLFERWIVRYSALESIMSDQGKEFCNKVMYAMCDLWRIKKKRMSPFYPQANTGAESFNRSFRKFFMTTLENTKTLEWDVREHKNIRMGGTIAILNAHV
jgi:hypothetical protein